MKVTKPHAASAAFVLLAGALGVVATATPASAALTGVDPTTTTTVLAGATTQLEGLGVTADAGEQVSVTLATTRGDLTVDMGTGITLAYGYSATGSEIAFTGSGAAVNLALDGTTLTTTAADKGESATITIMAQPAGDAVYSPSNGHFYEYVSAPGVSWTDAKTGATGHWFGGQQGYLATVPNAAVNQLIASRINGADNVWLGGAATNEGFFRVWRWKSGPLINEEFSLCSDTDYNALCDFAGTNGAYRSWSFGEPNNWDDGLSFVGEDYIVTNWNGDSGLWNDLPNSASGISGYVVEYGDLATGSTVPFAGVVNASSTVAIAGVPDVPFSVSATSGLGSVSVEFSAPVNTGGASVDGYQVIMYPNGTLTPCAASPCVLTGLPLGHPLAFAVQAHNAHGWSAESEQAIAQPGAVPGSLPPLPTLLLQGQTFAASAVTTGFPVPTYAVTAGSLPPGVTLNATTGEVAGTATTPGDWGFTVTATNTYSVSQRAYVGTTGARPALVTASLGSYVWHVPVDTTLVATGTPAGVWAVVSGALPSGLTLDTDGRLHGTPTTVGSYSATLSVTNIHGSDQRVYSAVVAGAEPSAPAQLGAVPGDGTLTVEFTAPAFDGGQIEGYQYSLDGGSTWLPRTDGEAGSPMVISGLTNGTTYSVLLRATNSGGPGLASAAVTGVPATVPDAPAITGVGNGNASATVAFEPPAFDGGSDVLWYEYSLDGGATWTRPDGVLHTSPMTIYGLTNGVDYSVTLRAVSAVGASDSSHAANARPAVGPVPIVGGPDYPELVPGAEGALVNGEAVQTDSSADRMSWNVTGPDFSLGLAAFDTAQRPVRIDGQAGSFVAYSGGYVRASGQGFAPGSSVDVWLFSQPVLLGTFPVGIDGTFSAMIPLPAGVAAGNHTVQVNALTAANETVSATMGIKVARTVPARLAATGADLPIGAAVALLVMGIPLIIVARRHTRSDLHG